MKTKNNRSWFAKNRWVVVAFSLALLIRLGLQIYFFPGLGDDPDAYRQIAENVANHEVYGQQFGDGPLQPTAYRPPLYPLILSGLVFGGHLSMLAVAAFHFLLTIGTLGFSFLFARQFNLSPWWIALIVLLVACDPIQLKQSSLVMTESLATFLATVSLWLSAKVFSTVPKPWKLFMLGLLVGLSALCRPTFVIWGALLLGVLIIVSFRRPGIRWPDVLKSSVAFLFGILVLLSPWMVRNQWLLGRPVFATTHGGYTIFLGNNPSFYDYLRSNRNEPWNGEKELKSVVAEIRQRCRRPNGTVDELKKDRLYYDFAIATIRERPGDFLYATWIRILRFWSVTPQGNTNSAAGRAIPILSGLWYLLVFGFALIGLANCSRRSNQKPLVAMLMPGFLMVLAFQGLHLVYWSNMRMRAPLVAFLSLLSGAWFAGHLGATSIITEDHY